MDNSILSDNSILPLIVGSAGIIWYVAWLLLVFNTPADHPRISPKEQYYIETAIKEETEFKQGDTSSKVIVKLALYI